MTRRPKPVMHGRDHAPDGPDPVPAAGAASYATAYEYFGAWNASHTHPQARLFDPAYFATNDTASFDLHSGELRALAAGGYLLKATALVPSWAGEDDGIFMEIDQIEAVKASGGAAEVGTSFGQVLAGSVTSLPFFGAGGATPAIQYLTLVVLEAADVPVTLRVWADWTFDHDHTGHTSLAALKFG